MAKRATNISTGGFLERKAVGCAVGLILVLLCGCGHSPGAGPGGDSGTVDAEQPEDHCPAIFNSASCTADWSECQSVNVRMLSDPRYQHQYISPIGLIVRDASTFEKRWQSCYIGYPVNPPLDLPDVDFSTEMVIWHVEEQARDPFGIEPEVWDCGGCLVFIPRYSTNNGDISGWAFTAVAVPSMDASVQFEESVWVF